MPNNPVIVAQNSPQTLEALFQQDSQKFSTNLTEALQEAPDSILLQAWNLRLNSKHTINDPILNLHLLVLLVISALMSLGWLVLPFTMDAYLQHYLTPTVFTLSCFWFFSRWWNTSIKPWVLAGLVGGWIVMTLMPSLDSNSGSALLSFIHTNVFLIAVLGLAFMGEDWVKTQKRLHYLLFLAETLIWLALILLGTWVLAAITQGLFSMIGIDIMESASTYLLPLCLFTLPLIAGWLASRQEPHGQISTLLASIFSPLFLLLMVVYLAFVFITGENPAQNRQALILMNILLLFVWAFIVLGITGRSVFRRSGIIDYVLLGLLAVSCVLDFTVLGALITRLQEFGLSGNRAAALGANILILVHLMIILHNFIKVLLSKTERTTLRKSIAFYLPIYGMWGALVATLFPVIW
jgi:hypothetical protein